MHSNFGLSRDEGFGEKMRENKIARKCTKILVSCICHHTIILFRRLFALKFWTPHILRTWIYPTSIEYFVSVWFQRIPLSKPLLENLTRHTGLPTQVCVFCKIIWNQAKLYISNSLFAIQSPRRSSYSSKLLDYFVQGTCPEMSTNKKFFTAKFFTANFLTSITWKWRHMMMLFQNWLHHWILRVGFTPFSHWNTNSIGINFSSIDLASNLPKMLIFGH